MSDSPGVRLRLDLPGLIKEVAESGCIGSDEADEVDSLANEVDEVAGTDDWL